MRCLEVKVNAELKRVLSPKNTPTLPIRDEVTTPVAATEHEMFLHFVATGSTGISQDTLANFDSLAMPKVVYL